MIKFLVLSIFFSSLSSNLDCAKLKVGTFTLKSIDGSIHTIVRTKTNQTEQVGKTGLVSKFDVKWIDECNYMLYNRRVIKTGSDTEQNQMNKDTVYNEIVEINGNSHKVISTMKGFDFKAETILEKQND